MIASIVKQIGVAMRVYYTEYLYVGLVILDQLFVNIVER
jgi:hypothetical protein